VATELVRQNVRYAEVFYSPRDFEAAGLQVEGLTEAIRAGLDEVAGVDIELICDLVRDQGPEVAADTVRRLVPIAERNGVIGIGLGGSEGPLPPELFTDVYRAARRAGLRCTAHAGEAAGPASVWGALRALEVERVGHGIRAIEDPGLVEHLAAAGIPLEVCPLSNVATGVVADLADHPVRRLHDAGVLVTVNTDDPAMFGNSLVDDFDALMRVHDFTPAEIQRVLLNAVDAAWLPTDRRRTMAATFEASPGWIPPAEVTG
jgi:adenosine deaminase